MAITAERSPAHPATALQKWIPLLVFPMVQFFLFDAKPMLQNKWLKIGYHGLTLVFAYHTVVYAWAALFGNGG